MRAGILNILIAVLAIIVLPQDNCAFAQEDLFKKMRERMVQSQILNRDIRDKSVLRAMNAVKRHEFVPDYLKLNAYDDTPLPIGHGQTISQPYIVAYMTDIIKPEKHHKILEIGSGSGYQAAVLAEIVDSVYTIEIIEELGEKAAERLQKLGYRNIELKIADGYYGWQEHAPFDAVVVTTAAEFIPPPLLEQLKEGGRMIIPVGSPFVVQTLMLVEKKNGSIRTTSLMPVRFVPFTRKK